MKTSQQEIEELLAAIEQIEKSMTTMQYRVSQLKHAARQAQKQPPVTRHDRAALQATAERLQRFAEPKRPAAPKRRLH